MAECWTRHVGDDRFQVQAAGIEMHGKNPRAIDVMREAGVDISRQESTRLTDQMLAAADYVVTVCGHADENQPKYAKNIGLSMILPRWSVQRGTLWLLSETAVTISG